MPESGRAYRFDATARWSDAPQGRDFKHLALHVAKKAGKLCAVAEELDHEGDPQDATKTNWEAVWARIENDDIPDLAILAAMLAEQRGIDLNDAIERRGKALWIREAQR